VAAGCGPEEVERFEHRGCKLIIVLGWCEGCGLRACWWLRRGWGRRRMREW
jgi:hypothetical protein